MMQSSDDAFKFNLPCNQSSQIESYSMMVSDTESNDCNDTNHDDMDGFNPIRGISSSSINCVLRNSFIVEPFRTTADKPRSNASTNASTSANANANTKYNDHASEASSSIDDAATSSVPQSFPEQIHHLLSQIDGGIADLNDIVSWQPHGRSFKIHNIERFQSQVLPEVFNITNLSTFQRQLNLYGFQIVASSVDPEYFHEMFLRCRSSLATCMKRVQLRKRARSIPESDVQLYKLPWMQSLNPSTPAETPTAVSIDDNLLPQTPAVEISAPVEEMAIPLKETAARVTTPPFPPFHPIEVDAFDDSLLNLSLEVSGLDCLDEAHETYDFLLESSLT